MTCMTGRTLTLGIGLLLLGLACRNDRPAAPIASPPPAPTAAAATAQPLPAVAPAPRVPLIFVHGTNGYPADWAPVMQQLSRGRLSLLEVYAGDTDALITGGLPSDTLFSFGYYRERKGSPLYYADRFPTWSSIGGCPVPRTDGYAARYTISFAQQLDRAVENICRATGSDRIDLVAFSMGGLVARAYTRWHSLKAPGGKSRVRRLLTVSSPNHGVNSLEATLWAASQNGVREHAKQGEVAELNYACGYWGGRSFIDHLNDGWDAFCVQQDVSYAAARGVGNAFQHQQAVRGLARVLGAALPSQLASLLTHPTPGFDLKHDLAEATGDGDGTVRTSSAYFDPAAYPHVRFNAVYYGTHDDPRQPERSLKLSTFTAALVRHFIFDGEEAAGFQATADIRAIDAGGDATWLLLDVDVTGGVPLVATVYTRSPLAQRVQPVTAPFGIGTEAYSVLLRPGRQQLVLDPAGSDGARDVELRLYGLDRMVVVNTPALQLQRAARPPVRFPAPEIGTPEHTGVGGLRIPLRAALAAAEFAFGLAGDTVVWSPFQTSSEMILPPLAPGRYELRLRARALSLPAGLWIEDARPAALQLTVHPSGGFSIRR